MTKFKTILSNGKEIAEEILSELGDAAGNLSEEEQKAVKVLGRTIARIALSKIGGEKLPERTVKHAVAQEALIYSIGAETVRKAVNAAFEAALERLSQAVQTHAA